MSSEGRGVARLAVECYVELGGIIIRRALLGQRLTVKSDRWAYRIDFPKQPDSFIFSRASINDAANDEREYEATLAYVDSPDRAIVDLRIVRIVVNASRERPLTEDKTEYDRWAEQIFFELREGALVAARDFTDLVRLRGQSRIEPTGRFPRILNAASLLEIIDSTHARDFGWSIAHAGGIIILGDEEILDQATLSGIEQDLNQQRGAWVGELLVGEALYLVESEQRTGPAQATLLAAMGVEIHTRDIIRHLATDEQRPILDLLLANPRDWSMAAHALFQKTLPTVVGKELGPEHKALSIRVQHLFTARNAVAHRGESVDREAAKGHVSAARDVVAFLRRLLWPIGDTTTD